MQKDERKNKNARMIRNRKDTAICNILREFNLLCQENITAWAHMVLWGCNYVQATFSALFKLLYHIHNLIQQLLVLPSVPHC